MCAKAEDGTHTLMKGNEGIEAIVKAAYRPLFVNRGPWDGNRFHSVDINTSAITNSVNMRF